DAGRKQETAERECVGGRNPLQITGAGAQGRGEGGKRRDQDGRVQSDDEATDDQGGEGPPAARPVCHSHSKVGVTPKIKLAYKVVTCPTPSLPPSGGGE